MDTNVLVAGLRSSVGWSHRVLRAIGERRLLLLASPPIFLEYEDVLTRPEQVAEHGHDVDTVAAVLRELAALVVPVDLNYRWRPQLRDPKDELFLEAAINGRATAIVTFNQRDFLPSAHTFGIDVWRPRQVLEALEP